MISFGDASKIQSTTQRMTISLKIKWTQRNYKMYWASKIVEQKIFLSAQI